MRIFSSFLLILWVIGWFPLVAAAYFCKKKKLRGEMVKCVCRGMLRLMGVQVNQLGALHAGRPLLVVSNHLSYLDILVLASAMDCRFVPKKEIARWPVISSICTLLDVVYIDRRPGKIHEGNQAIAAMLAAGEVVVLFPEATTGNGRHLLPFKPAFFEAGQGVTLQPVAIAYRKIRGLPIDYGQWPLIAWYGEMLLLPHWWKLLSLGCIEVDLHFLPPLESQGVDRKTLALQTHAMIEQALYPPV